MTPAELRDAERLVDRLIPQLEQRRTRRYELHSHGRRLAPAGDVPPQPGDGRPAHVVGLATTDPANRARSSSSPTSAGSMERHSRLLLRFVQALSSASEVRVESFVFGTRLTRVTRLLKDRDRDRALARVADAVNDWAGGTRIGESFRTFNQHWARRTLRTSGVVIVISDGWDRGDPALVAAETARLRRNCHRLVWLNPLAGTPGYQPLAGGMRAAFPYIDDFLPAGTVASLERLGEILGGVRSADIRDGVGGGRPCRPADGTSPAIRGAATPTAISRHARPTRPPRGRSHEGAPVDARDVAGRRRGCRPGRRRPHVRLARRGRRARSCCTRPTGASPGRSAVAASRGPRPRRSSTPGRPAAPGSSATASATSRPGTSGWPAAARSTSSSSRPCRPRRCAAALASQGAGGHGAAVVDAAPRRLATGRVRPAHAGGGGSARARARRPRRRSAGGHARRPGARRGARRGGRRGAQARPVADRRDRRPLAVHRGLPGPAAARHRRCGGGRPVARAARAGARVPDRGHRRPARRSRPRSGSPTSTRLVVGWPDEVADEIGLGPNDAVAVLTHDVKFDEPAIVEALRRGCRYVGAVGSKKTQADRRQRLLDAGVTPDELARLRGPVGLDLGGRQPAETALAILAEVVAERYGGSGVPLKDRALAGTAA